MSSTIVRSRGWLGLLLLVSAPAAVQAQQPTDSIFAACVANDTTSEWRQVAAAWQRGSAAPPTDPSLRTRLIELARRDQLIRQVPDMVDSLRSGTYIQRMTAVDSANAAALREIVQEHGWPTRTTVGTEGASAAFLLAQHNPSIQDWALDLMRTLPAGEVSPTDLAMLEDRVRVSHGKPQLFGTQLHATPDGKSMVFGPIADLAHVDARRAKLGLYPLDSYICMIQGVYGLNVQPPKPAGS